MRDATKKYKILCLIPIGLSIFCIIIIALASLLVNRFFWELIIVFVGFALAYLMLYVLEPVLNSRRDK